MAGKLDGRVALITGTGGGIGREAALRFAAEGAHVIGCDLKADGAAETLRLVRAAGGSMESMAPVDLGDPDQARAWVDQAAAGGIDILYNNASNAVFEPFETFSVEGWRACMRNEIDLYFYTTQAAWPYLRRRGGVVINTASLAGWLGGGHGCVAHATAKGAILAFTRQLAWEGGPHGIRVVSISPGLTETPATMGFTGDPAYRATRLKRNLVPRFGQASDIAAMALFLASDDAGFVTGSDHLIDGGARLARDV